MKSKSTFVALLRAVNVGGTGKLLSRGLTPALGSAATVLLRTPAQLRRARDNCPFAALDPARNFNTELGLMLLCDGRSGKIERGPSRE